MQEILLEIKELRKVIAQLVGHPDPSIQAPFSSDALNKAAKEFQKLNIERGEWIEEYHIDKYIKKAPYNAGKFIREELGFTSFFKRGSRYYYYRQDLIALATELKNRNIDLGRYIELKEDQARFEKYYKGFFDTTAKKKKRKIYYLPPYFKDIITSPPKLPEVAIVREDLKQLKQEFFEHKLSEYIDIYKGNYAMLKHLYPYRRYIAADILKRARNWCDHFNIANQVLQEITRKKEVFIPVPPEDQIQL